jgi:hypothetical protein
MGSHPKQAVALVFFLIAFTLIAAGMAGGGVLLLLPGVVLLGISAAILIKVKPLEHIES